MKRILIASVIGLAALTTACTGTTGSPTSSPTTGGTTSTSDSSPSSGLQSVKACELLTDAEATGFGFKVPGEAEKVLDADGCDWTASGNGGLQISVNANDGVKDLNLNRGKLSETKAGRFTATKIEAPDGAEAVCDIAISVSEKSSVLIVSSLNASSTDTAASCERATKAAELVAQKLP